MEVIKKRTLNVGWDIGSGGTSRHVTAKDDVCGVKQDPLEVQCCIYKQLLLYCHPRVVLLPGCRNSRLDGRCAPEHRHPCGRECQMPHCCVLASVGCPR